MGMMLLKVTKTSTLEGTSELTYECYAQMTTLLQNPFAKLLWYGKNITPYYGPYGLQMLRTDPAILHSRMVINNTPTLVGDVDMTDFTSHHL